MPGKRLPMRKLREVLRLYFESKLNERQIARICSIGKGTVQRYLQRTAAAGLSWPLPADLDDATLEKQLFPPPPLRAPAERPLPDFIAMHKDLGSRKNVTLQLLWEEYKETNPFGYNYSWFCDLYRDWRRQLDVVLRQEHRAGEKMFVDHAGQTVGVTDAKTGEPLPGLGAVALQAGRHVGQTIARLVAGESAEPFHYVDKGTMAQVGRGAAVVELPAGGTLTGHVAWLAWLGVHLSLLSGAEEKTSVFVDWGWNLVTHQRSKRIILTDEDTSTAPNH